MSLNGDLISGQSWQASNTNVTALAEIPYWRKKKKKSENTKRRNPHKKTLQQQHQFASKTSPEEMLAAALPALYSANDTE